MSVDIDALGRDQEDAVSDAAAAPASAGRSSAPACSVCGRQDETLRAVSYPYAFSAIVLTFRRAFAGVWCRKHRNQRLFLASAITALFGWLGIPFGLVWTPVTLFKLARGGNQPEDLNKTLLTILADCKQQAGDKLGAIRCLEACLRFGDDAAITERIRQMRTLLGPPVPQPTLRRIVSALPPALLVAFLVTTAAFTLDGLVTELVLPLFPGLGGSIYIDAFSWLPGIAIAFVGGLILSQVTEQAVVRLRIRRAFVGGAVGASIAVFAAYGVLQGLGVSQDLTAVLFSRGYGSLSDTVVYAVVSLIQGAAFAAVGLVELTGPVDVIYMVFIATSLVYYLAVAVGTAVRTAHWQQRLPTMAASEQLEVSRQALVQRPKQRGCLLGCGASLLILCLVSTSALGAIWVGSTLASRTPLGVDLACPEQVHEGDTFEAVISIHNVENQPGSDLAIDLDGSLGLSFYDGISVVQSDPPYSSAKEGSPGHQFYDYDLTVMPGETQEVIFEFKAERPGDFQGLIFVDVTIGSRRLHTQGTPIEVTVLP